MGLYILLTREQGETAAQEEALTLTLSCCNNKATRAANHGSAIWVYFAKGAKDNPAPHSQTLLIQGLRGRSIHGVKAAKQGSGMQNFCLYGLIR